MCANIIARDKEGNIVRQLMPCDYFEDRKQCHAPFLQSVDWLDKALVKSCEIKQPCNSCDKWEEQEERDFYAC